ncbi:MAG: type II toxin-antitoxin system RelB/DinJ family antitoxin [Candidatus Komeilibacteria bacterium]|nr:type II toxin-antitoxin system RelB/DinJ family antitoxin [Candidatus Komeilibacteria bacterium]
MKTIINIKADKEVKEQAQKIAKELGLPLSTVINASLKQFIRNKEVHFSTAPHMTPELEAVIGKAQSDLKARKNISRVFAHGEEIDDYLDSL